MSTYLYRRQNLAVWQSRNNWLLYKLKNTDVMYYSLGSLLITNKRCCSLKRIFARKLNNFWVSMGNKMLLIKGFEKTTSNKLPVQQINTDNKSNFSRKAFWEMRLRVSRRHHCCTSSNTKDYENKLHQALQKDSMLPANQIIRYHLMSGTIR